MILKLLTTGVRLPALLGVIVASSLGIMAVSSVIPPPPPLPPPRPPEAPPPETFSARFSGPIVVRTVPFVKEPEVQIAPVDVVAPPRKMQTTKAADVCAKYGMRRVDYGKRWRCRR